MKQWTTREVEQAVALRATGLTCGAISAQMSNRTEAAICNKLKYALRPREIIRAERLASAAQNRLLHPVTYVRPGEVPCD